MNRKYARSTRALLAALCGLSMVVGCQQELDVEHRTFHCSDDSDCLQGYSCRPFEAGENACQPLGVADGGTDSTFSDADARDADVALPCDEELVAKIEASAPTLDDPMVGADIRFSDDIMSTVDLDAAPSTGDIDGHKWTVQDRPTGSSSELSDPQLRSSSLLLDTYGVYELSLTVTDAAGSHSCTPASARITVEPDHPVAIQLTWHTPGDPDPSDNEATDLDLHYLHMHSDARWNQEPYDTFVGNPDPTWDTSTEPPRFPEMIASAADGSGPEHIVHRGLEEQEVSHRIAVYYEDDAGMGTSYATVRVYIDGQLEVSLEDKPLEATGNFWTVGIIDANRMEVRLNNSMDDGFP